MASDEVPEYRTGWIWIILTVFLVFGTVGSAFAIYGATGLAGGGPLLPGAAEVLGGGAVAVLCLMFVAGILYRADRLRGVPHREVALFE